LLASLATVADVNPDELEGLRDNKCRKGSK
jgi:hypothetical protein